MPSSPGLRKLVYDGRDHVDHIYSP